MFPCQCQPPEIFFGPADSPAGAPPNAWESRALAVCATCPAIAACLAEALRYPGWEQYGVVGGTTASQRRALLADERTSRREVAA